MKENSLISILLIFMFILLICFFIGCGGENDGSSISGVTNPTLPPIPEWPSGDYPTTIPAPGQNTGDAVGYVVARIDGEHDVNSLNVFFLSYPPLLSNYGPVSNAVIQLTSNPFIEAISDETGKFILQEVPYCNIDNIQTVTVTGDTENIQATEQFVAMDFAIIVNPLESPGNIVATKVFPEDITLVPGQVYQFKAYCKNSAGEFVYPDEVEWSVIGGIGNIDEEGVLTVGTATGSGTVTANVQGMAGNASIEVINRDNMGSVTGTVKYSDGSGASTSRVSVKTSGITYITIPDASGQYNLNNIPPGTRTVEVKYDSNLLHSEAIAIQPSQTSNLDINLDFDPIGPSIESISRDIGPPGTLITIIGEHFGINQGSSTVTFSGVNITPSSWSNDTITLIPSGAVTGDIVVTVHGISSNPLEFSIVEIDYITFVSSIDTGRISLYELSSLSLLELINTPIYNMNENPDITPDGRYIVYDALDSNLEIFLYDRNTSSMISLPNLSESGSDSDPSINSTGEYIAFTSNRPGGQGEYDIYLYDRNTSSIVSLPGLNSAYVDKEPSISGDGRYIAFSSDRFRTLGGGYTHEFDIFLYDRNTSSIIDLPNLNSSPVDFRGGDYTPSLNSDGRYIAFTSDRDYDTNIYLYDRNTSSLVDLPDINSETQDTGNSINSSGRYIGFVSKRDGTSSLYLYDRNISKVINLSITNSSGNSISN